VTLQFRNAGLKEVLEALGKAARVNFVFDKDVRNDPVTVSLEDKPFDEALTLVLNSNSLFAQKAGPSLRNRNSIKISLSERFICPPPRPRIWSRC
jgi:general secretion pathway protein D